MERMFEQCRFCGHERRFHISDAKTQQTECTICPTKRKVCKAYTGPVGGI
jgi:hypothetical protein